MNGGCHRPPTPLARPAPGVRKHRPEALGTLSKYIILYMGWCFYK